MGMIWRAMPLLSTLAALVIIAHSAEEGYDDRRMDRDYRYELKPRLLDTGTPSYDQPWRAIDPEPMMQDPVSEDHEFDLPIKRRRRKRKRRPLTSSEEIPQERDIHQEETRYLEPEVSQDATEVPRLRRRRKRPGPGRQTRWTDEFYEFDRPLRRRNRRKRPVLEAGPKLSESDLPIPEHTSGEFRNENPTTADDHVTNDSREQKDHVTTDDYENHVREKDKFKTTSQRYVDLSSSETPEDYTNYSEKPYKPYHEDTSQSEFSVEDISENADQRGKSKLASNVKKTLESGPINPVALKEILKRSNGASLSEILQERNLSLADLLHGRQDAISALKSKQLKRKFINSSKNISNNYEPKQTTENHDETKTTVATQVAQSETSTKSYIDSKQIENKPETLDNSTYAHDSDERLEAKENGPRIATMRRFPGNTIVRRKLRLRPDNTTTKGLLNKVLVTQTARKYLYMNNRNSTKGKESKHVSHYINITPSSKEINTTENTEVPIEIETTTQLQKETTTTMPEDDDENEEDDTYEPETEVNIEMDTSNEHDPNESQTESDETEAPSTIIILTTTTEITTTEKTKVRYERPVPDEKKIGPRRQALNNRLKRKRLKQKNTTMENQENEEVKDLLGLGNLVASSEFIARTQKPDTPLPRNTEEDFTSLDDFLTTPISRRPENVKTTRISTYVTPRRTSSTIRSTTEETAKIEIEEILNDTRTSARLSKILMERNMTLNELVEHRERGSSHVHLADIFHNASKEPNPPEPFLSKSSIEPISRETYPLRALLEANLHDPVVKATSIEPNIPQHIHIPIVMDFGNNVNENGENMGIISLLNKITNKANVESSDVKKDSEGTPYISTIINVNASIANSSDNVRESKELKDTEVGGWNKLFEFMRRHHENTTGDELTTWSTGDTIPEATNLDIKDADGDGLIVLEDLQRLNALENNIRPKFAEKLDINTLESDTTIQPGILNRLPSSTRSVTVATASIVGLTMVLFLLTYSAFKWKQKRSMLRKKQSFSEDRIPTPVFENKKSNKSNCSTRSISPMLASNIYTMNTLDSRAGTESPEYMWDTLRKPFQ